MLFETLVQCLQTTQSPALLHAKSCAIQPLAAEKKTTTNEQKDLENIQLPHNCQALFALKRMMLRKQITSHSIFCRIVSVLCYFLPACLISFMFDAVVVSAAPVQLSSGVSFINLFFALAGFLVWLLSLFGFFFCHCECTWACCVSVSPFRVCEETINAINAPWHFNYSLWQRKDFDFFSSLVYTTQMRYHWYTCAVIFISSIRVCVFFFSFNCRNNWSLSSFRWQETLAQIIKSS